jgi:hypothetical protein
VLRHGKKVPAHRFSYEISNGPIPPGMMVCHHCDTRACIRPSHLFLGTQKDNIQDAVSKNRMARGTRHGSHTKPETLRRGMGHGMAKLKDDEVIQIRQLAGSATQEAIAKLYGVSQFKVSSIIRRKTWAHI